MWVAKVKFDTKDTLIGTKVVKHGIDLFAFPLSWTYEKDWIIVHITGTVFGSDVNKKKFVKELRKEKRVLNFELNDDFFIGTIKEPIFMRFVYNKNIFHISPAYISEKGFEIGYVGSFDKKDVLNVATTLEKHRNGKLLSIKNEKIKSISIVKIRPELTKKQRSAIELAIKHGYYHSPRRIDVKTLANLSGLSFSTYQVHLRKAEAKLIPYLLE